MGCSCNHKSDLLFELLLLGINLCEVVEFVQHSNVLKVLKVPSVVALIAEIFNQLNAPCSCDHVEHGKTLEAFAGASV